VLFLFQYHIVMKTNKTTLGLDCFISVRNKKTKKVEKQENRCFFGVPCSDEGKEMIRYAIESELLSEGKDLKDFSILVE